MIKHEALNFSAYRHLKQMILNSDLEFNTIYSETKIASELNISRTPIRDALVRLSQEHYVDIIPSKGFMLHKPDVDDLAHARHFRIAMEGYGASLIVREPDDPENAALIEKMEHVLQQQREVANHEHLKQFWKLDVQFHTLLVSRLSNPYFDSLYTTSNYLFTSLPVASFFSENRHITTMDEHASIIGTLKNGHTEDVYKAISSHIDESYRVIKNDIRQYDKENPQIGIRTAT